MRHYLRLIIINAIAFWIVYNFIGTIKIGDDVRNILLIIAGLSTVSLITEPIFGLILLPINVLTFGLLSLVLNIIVLFVFLNFLPGFNIGTYNFPGADIQGVILRPANLNFLSTILVIAAIITLSQKILHFIFT